MLQFPGLSAPRFPEATVMLLRCILPRLLVGALLPAGLGVAAPRGDGQLRLEVIDAATRQPMAVRMELKTARGRAVKLRRPEIPLFGDHLYIDGEATLPLARGQYVFVLDAGPEYRTQSGHFEIERHADDSKTVEMHRVVDMAQEGWWAGDLDVSRRPDDLPLAMRAEAIRFAPAWEASPDQSPLLLRFGDRLVARTPQAWDFPVWLARDHLVAVQLIAPPDDAEDIRARDRLMFPGAGGAGRWSEAIYYHALNCGLRLPPAAGSGSGRNERPLGTDRVYVHCGEAFSPDRWWDGLEQGRVIVTNGPLLRPLVDGRLPGHVFYLDDGDRLDMEIRLSLATREPVEYLEIVKNGDVERSVRLDDLAKSRGRLPTLTFTESGWFLVRAVTTATHTYQFASSGPYYVERAGRPRISRRSVQFFLDWIDQRTAALRQRADVDATTQRELLAAQAAARQFFVERLAAANAD